MWQNLLENPILNTLVYFYNLTGNLGIAIILLTIVVRSLLLPVVLPSMKSMKKQRDLQPEIEKLKKKYANDKQALAKEQMLLLKQHGINPASGCLTQVVMLLVLIALFSVIRLMTVNPDVANINQRLYSSSLAIESAQAIKTGFLYMDLSKPDPYYILALLSGVLQFFITKLTKPFTQLGQDAAEKTKSKEDDFAYQMQNQMTFMLPIMNAVVALTLPAGVALYIVIGSVYSLVQQYALNNTETIRRWIKSIKSGKSR